MSFTTGTSSVKSLKAILTLAAAVCTLTVSVGAQDIASGDAAAGQLLEDLQAEGERVAQLLEWDSSMTALLAASLERIEMRREEFPNRTAVYQRLLDHYRAMDKYNKSRVKDNFEALLFEWLRPLASASGTSESAVDRVIRSFPEAYFPVKVLAPELLTDSALAVMARQYPKDVLYALRYMIAPDGLAEAEIAALHAPYEAKQYLHYKNSVNDLLQTSDDPRIGQLYALYEKYRYGSNSFYLLQPVYDGSLSMEAAHAIGKDREQLYNALVAIFRQEDALGRFSAEEKLSELSDRYVRKIMFQRYLPTSRLELDQLAALTGESRVFLLFSSQNLLKKKDLQHLAVLLERYDMPPVTEASMAWLPNEWILLLESRLAEEEIPETFDFLVDGSLWAKAHKLPETEAAYLSADPRGILRPGSLDVGEIAEPVFVFRPYMARLSETDKQLIRLANNPYELLADLSLATGQLYSRKMILALAMEYPVEVVAQLEKFQDQPYAAEVCRKLVLNAPLTAKNYIIKDGHRIHNFLQNSNDSTIELLYSIDEALGSWTRAYILLEKIHSGELTMEEADIIAKERQQLIPHLIDIFIRDEYLGRYTVEKELEYAALDFIRKFNISENTDRNYRERLDELDAATIYAYLLFGEQEIISNTYRRMYDRLMGLAGDDFPGFLESMNYTGVDRFLRMAVHYGREADFFSRLNEQDEKQVWSAVFNGIAESGEYAVSKAIEAGEIITWIEDRARLLELQEIIRTEYERLAEEHNDEGVVAYGVLASIMAQRLQDGWSVYAAPYYEIPDLVTIPVHSLFNDRLVNVQHYYFYNDRDGLYSYRNFLQQYERSDYNWKIEDLGNFVRISSKSGKSVEIYANKPGAGEDGIAELEAYLDMNGLEPQIVVHRGLSTHTLKTFRKIPASAKLILDGSCGGFHIQSVALENAPGAHILCNRNIGTMHINDPMFKQISEAIREGRDIVWPNFWSDMEARLGSNPYFQDYIPPHKNVAALIIKAYYDVLDIQQ